MVDAFAFSAGLEDCEVETKVSKSYRGYRFKREDPVVRIAHEALERSGYAPSYGLSGGAADANIFNERGLACLNLANGMQDIHTADERITVDDLEGMVEVTLALFDVARDADA
jgi:tripeptide aminopeptidase